jgi:hypothetical protein
MEGRPTKKTPERVDAILRALKAGNTRKAAACFAEIHVDTFYEWMKADPSFSDAVEKSEADAEVRFVTRIATAAEETWQAAAWWLERRRPDDYRQQNATHVSGNLQVGLSELMREARKTKTAARDAESPPPSPEV